MINTHQYLIPEPLKKLGMIMLPYFLTALPNPIFVVKPDARKPQRGPKNIPSVREVIPMVIK